jgi:hypothetical protein
VTSKTEQAVELIRQAGARGMRTHEINAALDIDCASALLAGRVLDKTLSCHKATDPHITRPVNEYHHRDFASDDALAAGAEMGRRAEPAPRGCTEIVKHFARDDVQKAAPEVQKSVPAAAPLNGVKRVGAIEKGVPLPASKRGNGELRTRLSGLEVGDSFVTAYSPKACYGMAKTLGIKITYRPDDEPKQIRVWRIEG